MDHLTMSLVVGAIAGAVVVIPMLIQGCSVRSAVSTLCIFLFTGLIVYHSALPRLPWWTQGMAVALMLTLPVIISEAGKDRKTIPMSLFNAILFGFLISAAERFL